MAQEILLLGGDVAAAVVRVGDTVRKTASPAVEALLRYVEGGDRGATS